MKLSDYIVEFLENNGVSDMFMLTGGGCMHLVDSFGKSKKINYYCNHHEQACSMAAPAYAKIKNELGVVLITSGPGATNTITGLLGAYQDSTPCLFISGQAKRKQTIYNSNIPSLRQFGAQETNIIPIVDSITKYAVMVNDPYKIKYHLEKALHLAKSGRPGPVWIDVPLDVQGTDINKDELEGFNVSDINQDYKINPDDSSIAKTINSLKKATRPIIIAGHGIRLANACSDFIALVEKFNIPVVTSMMGVDVINGDNINFIGRIGIKGSRAGNFALQNSDLVISIGCRLSVPTVGHEYNLFAREAEIIVVDIDNNEHKKKTIKIDKFINADARLFINKLNQTIGNNSIGNYINWQTKCNEWKNKFPVCLPEYKFSKGGVNFYYFMEILNNKIKAEVPVVSDAGSAFYIVPQIINIKKGQRHITTGALGEMGFGLPGAIGVSAAINKKSVVTITGDGSFQQNVQELQTIIHNNLPIKIFVINNGGYLSIRETQKKFFNGNLVGEGDTSGVSFPETSKISKAYDIKYIKIDNVSMLEKKIDEVLNYNGPVICEVISPKDQPVLPTNSARILPDGTMVSSPLEDMFPFLDRDEFKSNMIVKPCNDV